MDVSHWNTPIPWGDLVEAGIGFAIVKATEGQSWVDPSLTTSWAASHACGLDVGLYHFLVVDDPGSAQAGHIARVLEGLDGEPALGLFIDVESTDRQEIEPASTAALLVELGEALDDLLGHRAPRLGIYTDAATFDAMAAEQPGLCDWRPWLVSHDGSVPEPTACTAVLWQHPRPWQVGSHALDLDQWVDGGSGPR